MFVHTHIAKYKSLSTELHTTTNTRTFIKSISASSCLSIMESLDSALPEVRQDIEQNIADLDDLYSALLQTRWDIEQNISNLKEPFQRLINAETIGDIRKYLLDLSPAFCELHLLFDRLGGFTSCALGMDVEKRELDEFRCHIAELWGDYGHALQMEYIFSLCCKLGDAKLCQGVEYLQEKMCDLQVVCAESMEQLEEDL
ncbi:hypothetical protein I7I51_05051 [Histoplasma capsulatum]|uniref:Uncharacterized protein n=1 Tax=Ajellomyces capsulatus TaxID=5037 RepID=A0A8A1M6J2_AJECA|nr:hypothetical protein I7I51_05051 [Histoplasma capsulatum]